MGYSSGFCGFRLPLIELSTGRAARLPVVATAWQTKDMAVQQPRFLTLTDVAEILNVSSRQVYALVRTGELRGIQIGGRGMWRVEADELEKYIARQYERAEEIVDDA